LRVTLYTKADCSLCSEAEAALLRIQRLIRFDTEFVYIEDDEDLRERYAERVPVVVVDGKEIAAAPLDEIGLQAALSAAV
jgi:glutaredoxin